ncbi:tRNA (cmo5U34)-methyltransferase [Devosia subaequoris]|uniref:tRNA (Cmo5U34)-methyltransferase n=1 Tax=Devosia subaequoris TaxID=395930 RepID=A0A7W6ILP9_9HYPH|nr:class I SAM-dependent methyltransferase [Devosia subaequoris]MBB4051960.1 tRNA (cmo5U34)-methyltransferase [Devosia subaequoris]MCP1210126.1 methyltransferase domain-containing protein [Devosia subaequoris]
MSEFADVAQRYAEGPPRQVPGLDSLHRMTDLLLTERVPETGRVLVLGAGGGMELRNLASRHAGWQFDGVDPSEQMLDTARAATAAFADRVQLHEGTIAEAPEGPFDGATCLLTFHFIRLDERLDTLVQLRRRLRPGAPLVLAHMSFPQDAQSREIWMRRHAAFAVSNGVDPAHAENGRTAMLERLHLLSPEDEERMMAEADFSSVSLFFAGFNFRGWVAYA